MSASYVSPIYWGSGDEGKKIYEAILRHCQTQDISVSAFIKALVEKEMRLKV